MKDFVFGTGPRNENAVVVEATFAFFPGRGKRTEEGRVEGLPVASPVSFAGSPGIGVLGCLLRMEMNGTCAKEC